MSDAPRHHRIILHLRYGAAERVTIRAAAELSRMLGLALHGVFLEDEALTELTDLPFIREFRLTTGVWQQLDRQRISDERRAAVSEARRLLDEAAASFGVTFLFDTARGTPGALVTATSQAGDIVVAPQPRVPAEKLADATAGWLAAAHACGASVMLVPQVPARSTGPVAAMVCAESDPALEIAARIAAGAGETLLLLVLGTPELAQAAAGKAEAAGVPRSRILIRSIRGVAPDDVLQGLAADEERLVVLGRGACGTDDAAVSSRIADARRVPVLVVEP
jgi:hypothetical protein